MTNTNIRSFVPIQKLGEGSFASVYKVKRVEDQQIYALKKIKMNRLHQKAKENSLNQVRFLASFHSPFIAKYYQAFFDQNLDVLCIVMEFAEGGDLRKMIEKHKKQKRLITQIQIWKIMIHLTFGLKILHDNKILHRDIKCENILISDGKYKIGDLNVSKVNKMGFVDTQTGTPYYSSPEVWKDQPYNQKSDIWSLGCILYEIATLRPPFTGTNMDQLYKNVLRGVYSPIPKCYSHQLSSVIKQCLEITPSKRPSTLQIINNSTFKIYENICLQSKIPEFKMNVQMLQTICLPKDINQLNKCLPKSKYQGQNQNNQQAVITEKIQQQVECIKVIENYEVEINKNPIQLKAKENVVLSQNRNIQINKKQTSSQKQLSLKPSPILNTSTNKQNTVIFQSINNQRLKSYSSKITQTNKRRVLMEISKQIALDKPKSRSRSLPRTQNKSMSLSKQLAHQAQKKQAQLINLKNNQSQHVNQIKIGIKGKNRYWNIVQQAKKYLQRSLHKNNKIF